MRWIRPATAAAPSGRHALRQASQRPARQSGAIAIMCALSLIIIVGFLALALDLSQLYNRKMELQNAADAAALAAAHELDGSALGIESAVQHASDRFSAPAPRAVTYAYGKRTMSWSSNAIAFGDSPSGPWRGAAEAQANPGRLLYVKVDTDGLPGNHGAIRTMFLQIFFSSTASTTRATAVAGRSGLRVTPLGICAMRNAAQRDHNGELEEHGFRRGVGYNLLDLAHTEAAASEAYIVSPLPGTTPITSISTLGPFFCTGTMAMTRLTGGGKVAVSSPFPIGSLYQHLNSRFGSYSTTIAAPCDSRTAPSDINIMEYNTSATGTPWMAVRPQGQSAKLLLAEGRRWNVAGPDTAPADTTAAQFGPLWSYARAVPYAAYETDKPEPAAGYPTYDTTAWETLYAPGKPTTSTTTHYPSAAATPTPYSYTSGDVFYKPPLSNSNRFVRNRRVLNLPLLSCPVSEGKATVLGIGRFFMTVPATSTSLYGEFAGLVPEQALGTQVVLYP